MEVGTFSGSKYINALSPAAATARNLILVKSNVMKLRRVSGNFDAF